MNEVNLVINWLIIVTCLAASVKLTGNRKARFVFLTGGAILAFLYCRANEISLAESMHAFLRKFAELLSRAVSHYQICIG